MLSSQQIELISGLPQEGSYQSHFSRMPVLDDQRIDRLVDQALSGVEQSPNKQALITWGPPGSGKDTVLDARADHALISYDEGPNDNGAIYLLPGFLEEMKYTATDFVGQMDPVDEASLKDREHLWKDFQPPAQALRGAIIKEALMRELSIDVSTTSSSLGNLKLIELLRALNYQNIEMLGVFASFDVSKSRIFQRPRPGDPINDPVNKRIGALSTFAEYVGSADQFKLYSNDHNGKEPVLVAVFEKGQMIGADTAELNELLETIGCDRQAIHNYLTALSDEDQSIDHAFIQQKMDEYDLAAKAFISFIEQNRCDLDDQCEQQDGLSGHIIDDEFTP